MESKQPSSDDYCRRYSEVVCALEAASGVGQLLLYEELMSLCEEWEAAVVADLALAEEGSAQFELEETEEAVKLHERLERCRTTTQILRGAIAQTFDMAMAKKEETIIALRYGASAA